jgi:hypothetical protein
LADLGNTTGSLCAAVHRRVQLARSRYEQRAPEPVMVLLDAADVYCLGFTAAVPALHSRVLLTTDLRIRTLDAVLFRLELIKQ